jgi:plasmid stability protein
VIRAEARFRWPSPCDTSLMPGLRLRFLLRAGRLASYDVHMSTTITIRTDDKLRRQLEEHAAARGKSLSGTIREILEAAMAPQPLARRAGHLRGRLELPRPESEPWRQKLRERNWRP